VVIHPKDAEARGIRVGDYVRVFNDRGARHCNLGGAGTQSDNRVDIARI
jgi:anaerobic selenocysteine-containing dehydrogenase